MPLCDHCRGEFEPERSSGRFCSSACRLRAFQRRQAGLAEWSYPIGAHRGPVPLTQLTRRERAAEILTTPLRV